MNQVQHQKISCIIPVFNEQESLPHVLNDIPYDLIDEVIVIDNGSTDRTAEIAHSFGAKVLTETERGYGAACLTGINYLRSKQEKPDILVFLDGDYSDYPQEAENLIAKIHEGFDFVLGSRVLGVEVYRAELPPHSVFGNKLAAFFLNNFFGGDYTDLGPFRCIRFDKLIALDMRDKNFGWTMEMQIKALRHKLKTTEIPVHYRERYGGVSKVTGTFWGSTKAFLKITYIVILYLLRIRK